MKLPTPQGFPTEVIVQSAPDKALLPEGAWTLVGDMALRDVWLKAGMPEPEGSLWVSVDEPHKRIETILPWLEHWAEIPLHRDGTIVALGGGVLTDLAGLGASLYLRGIAWQTWPTTLLAQADAGLGGKTGADLNHGKNLVGAFHSPKRLVACLSFLDSLPARHVESGRWELVKTAFIQGDLTWAEELLKGDAPKAAWIERALAFKAEVVHGDPTETGERRLLNLGHTLGHALESASGYQLLHGEAVGLGLLASCLMGESLGLVPFPPDLLQRMRDRLAPLAGMIAPWEACLPWLLRDKKAHSMDHGSGKIEIRCILPRLHDRAVQRSLPAEAWAEPHARMLHMISQEAHRV